MAESNITKQALADALKELLQEHPFDKISISDICGKCHMNRKSFYYHFRDKFDLVNWIFDTEFIALNQMSSEENKKVSFDYEDWWKHIARICNYFYENRNFYNRVMKADGQNSFVAHFREFIRPILYFQIEKVEGQENVPQMVYDFIVDGIICSIGRWLMDKECISPEEYMHNLKIMIQIMYIGLLKRVSQDSRWLE